MATNSNVGIGEKIGRNLGAALGRLLGGRAGRALGVWLANARSRSESDGEASAGHDATNETSTDEASADDATEASSDDTDRPDTRTELNERSYRELQTLAKEVGVTANLSREEMTDRLVETLGIDEDD